MLSSTSSIKLRNSKLNVSTVDEQIHSVTTYEHKIQVVKTQFLRLFTVFIVISVTHFQLNIGDLVCTDEQLFSS